MAWHGAAMTLEDRGTPAGQTDGAEHRWKGPGPDPVEWLKQYDEREKREHERTLAAYGEWCRLRRNGEHKAAAALARAFGQETTYE